MGVLRSGCLNLVCTNDSFLQENYVSLSAEPYYKDKSNKLLVGIGKLDPNYAVGEARYDWMSKDYEPLDRNLDQS